MDSFHEPRRAPEHIRPAEVRDAVFQREQDLRAKGIELSGRVLHVCHYLPLAATLHSPAKSGILSPPATPPHQPGDIPPSPSTEQGAPPGLSESPSPKWTIAGRQGHAAMISGIRSLSATHEQVIIGWTGDILRPHTTSCTSWRHMSHEFSYDWLASAAGERAKVSTDVLSEEDKASLAETIAEYDPEELEDKGKTKYVPVWLDDKVAHGHYDGYCKESTFSYPGRRSKLSFSPWVCRYPISSDSGRASMRLFCGSGSAPSCAFDACTRRLMYARRFPAFRISSGRLRHASCGGCRSSIL
jgi:trehalose 6-phosphate synthase/phosphatase